MNSLRDLQSIIFENSDKFSEQTYIELMNALKNVYECVSTTPSVFDPLFDQVIVHND